MKPGAANAGVSVGPGSGRFVLAGALLLLLATYLVYRPGIEGPYLLDDVINLGVLEQGEESRLEAMQRVVFGNRSGPAGRPVAMASFLLDARDWPVPAAVFKHTNVLIHLLTGVLAGWFSLLLFSRLGVTLARRRLMALFVAAVWLLHPLNVSTTLYVIQRMTQFMALFSLAGLICYMHALGREDIGKSSLPYLCLALFPFGLLAVLSKENGALLLVALLSLHGTVFAGRRQTGVYRLWFSLGVMLPLLVLVLYLAFNFERLTAGYEFHEFGLVERLLTQARILCAALVSIFTPVISGFTLFHDDIDISRTLLSPVSTLVSVAVIAVLIVVAFLQRRRQPILAFGIFWFFGWHLLESTFLPLELYFEHRNYLPMLGPLITATWYGAVLLDRAGSGLRRLIQGLTVIVLVALLMLTLQLTLLWRDELVLKAYWAEQHPASFRAQMEYAYALAGANRAAEGQRHLETLQNHYPDEAVVLLQGWSYACQFGLPTPYTLEEISSRQTLYYLKGDISIAVRNLLNNLLEEACSFPDQDRVLAVMARLDELPMRPNETGAFHLLYSDFYVYYRQLDPALVELRRSFEARPDPGVLIRQAILTATAGMYDQSLVFLQRAREADRNRAPMLPSRQAEIDAMESDLKARLEGVPASIDQR